MTWCRDSTSEHAARELPLSKTLIQRPGLLLHYFRFLSVPKIKRSSGELCLALRKDDGMTFHPMKLHLSVILMATTAVLWEPMQAQPTTSIRGTVTLSQDNSPVAGAYVLLLGANDIVMTNSDGTYEIEGLQAGSYEVLVQREHLTAEMQTAVVETGKTATLDFALSLARIHEELTVTTTSSGSIGTALEAFNAISVVDTTDIAERSSNSLAELLSSEIGIAVREFGPGAARPIIRGFDGDRVLIMEDGLRSGDLGSGSADHGLTIDPNRANRIEVVRGPAALLYGSNAIGGVVNIISAQEQRAQNLTDGTSGHFGFDSGTANSQLGTSASFQSATGNILFWGGGSSRRTADYGTPIGRVENSASTLMSGDAGIGYFGDRFFASAGISIDDGVYGVPFAGDFHGHHGGHEFHDDDHGDDHDDDHDDGHGDELFVDIETLRTVAKVDLGIHNLEHSWIHGIKFSARMIGYEHDEVETLGANREIATHFDNRTYVMRAEVQQRDDGFLHGRFGVWGLVRKYGARGEEALSPDVEQAAFAAFGYEELRIGRHRLQFGGRIERNRYDVTGQRAGETFSNPHSGHENHIDEHIQFSLPEPTNRKFLGVTESLGYQLDLAHDMSLVANVTRSTRAPAIEELYNFGPHVGMLAYEVGKPNLKTEVSSGLDLGFRHQSRATNSNINFYVYDIQDFVFLAGTGERIDGLPVGLWSQGNSRFFGFDAETSIRMAGDISVGLGIGMVNAKLTDTNEALPRIPPLRATLRFTVPYRGFRISPEWTLSNKQERVYVGETVTAGYSTFNLQASYILPTTTLTHVVSLTAYNMTNALYRNHTSFIKDLAPAMGRGVKVGYTIRFF